MTIQRMQPAEIRFASRFDGHAYQRQHPQYQLAEALQGYWQHQSWYHLPKVEAFATLSLLLKAIETWERSPRVSSEYLDAYYDAFHSLYEFLKHEPLPGTPNNG